jgi:tRNA1(Val) A37 N6-methylase TrmN6
MVNEAEPESSRESEPDAMGEDALLGGSVRFRQGRDGYRAAIDPVFLAAAVPARAGESVLDVGAGAGAASLCLARRVAGVHITGLEIDGALAGLARDNGALNGFEDRFRVLEGDLLAPPSIPGAGAFDHVMANPPFLPAGRGNVSPKRRRASANVEGEADLADWIAFSYAMVRRKGTVTLIHRADRLDAILSHMHGRLGDIVVFPLWPGLEKPASRVIVSGRKGVASPLRLASGLVLHDPEGAFTPGADSVLRAGAGLDLRGQRP